ncbi:type I DNA topoisomerase [Synechococcus sp. PCC 7336]|uniref:type I DNA topoisomerase n=1 Tax=Synechococcus sp. PCC 7336 TaxID=195250 RepID=UPI00034BAD77|nr:type I DNA topoisomerase [Synechococcus sp. PCC 7336]
MTALVIVESPTKARTIRNFLPAGYQVEASMGHIRDLPQSASEIPAAVKKEEWSRIGVNVRANFEPLYVIPKDKQKRVKELRAALKSAEELILATDEDREGESISWHLQQVLKPKVPIKRMVFHEITREAIQAALADCRDIDEHLVRAQETRRILDRLVGYTLSPLLWKKIAPRLSAGRVQSVAVTLLVERERERRAFKQGSYWDLKADLEHDNTAFGATLVALAGKKLATGKDFDESTGRIAAGRDVLLLDKVQAEALQARIADKEWLVATVEERASTRKPAPPFTTSTLQQEANRKLRQSARNTMRTAQKLYEEGYITYMRTDSVHLSQQAISAARDCVEAKYGSDFLSPAPRQFSTKSKGAQEAHEAIRPAGSQFRTPADTPLKGPELALYDLIWKRTVATQMANARQTHTTVTLEVEDAEFRATGKRIDFPGFFRAYVEGSDNPDAALEDREAILPQLAVGDRPNCTAVNPVGHETQPPARYTEASLVKALEKEGVGRPSTYATIISTIQDRGYAQMVKNALTPTYTAFAVTNLLQEHFPTLVDTHFTAEMESTLDNIASGTAEWLPYLSEFYLGEEGLETRVKVRETDIEPSKARSIQLDGLETAIRIGQYGPYIQVEGQAGEVRASIPNDVPPADLDAADLERAIKTKLEGPEQLGTFPDTDDPIYLLVGPYGPYVQLGQVSEENKKPKRVSLPKGLSAEDVTEAKAIALLRLPRTLGEHPETGKTVKAGLGRFGPYVVCDGEFRSLKKDDDVLSVELPRALELLAIPKRGRGGSTAKPLRELGAHPEDGEVVGVFDGRYGPYVKHGKVNASLPKDVGIEEVTLEQAMELLAARANQKGGTKGKKAKASSKASSKSKTTSKTKAKASSATKSKTSTRKKTSS